MYSRYSTMARLPGYWQSGVVICSKYKLSDKQIHVISQNGSAKRHGYPDIDKEIISATVHLPQNRNIKLVAAHPNAIVDGLNIHFGGIKSINNLLHSDNFKKNTFLVGDMNQWRYMPMSLSYKLKDIMQYRTGTFIKPTWRYSGHSFTSIRANLDYVYWSKESSFSLNDFKVLSASVSDHRPLLATFIYK